MPHPKERIFAVYTRPADSSSKPITYPTVVRVLILQLYSVALSFPLFQRSAAV